MFSVFRRKFTAMFHRPLSGSLVLLALTVSPLRGQVAYEAPPTFPASALAPAGMLKGDDFTIAEPVHTDGLLALFHLQTAFGEFDCRGVEMLTMRIHELHALEEIAAMSRTELFTNAAKAGLMKPVDSAIKIVRDPVGSVKSVPAGVGRLFGSITKGAEAVGRTVSKKSGEIASGERDPDAGKPDARQDPFGFNKARNQWAAKFNVDPYTSNEELARKLSDLAKMSFSTQTIATLGVGQIAAPLAMVGTVDTLVLTKSPAEVREINAGRLAKLGVTQRTRGELLGNRWFTPTLQTRFVKALQALGAAKNLSNVVALTGNVRSEDEARFLCRGVELLGRYQAQIAPFGELRAFGRIPGGVTADGTLVISAPVEVIAWTELVASFAGRLTGKDLKPVICTPALITKPAAAQLAALGWQVQKL